MALGDEGWFFVNGELAGELDLSGWEQAGDVRAIGSFFPETELAGEATAFEDFTVWSLDKSYGPTSGAIAHDPEDNVIAARRSGVTVAHFVAQARFFNPYPASTGPWNYGFIFRGSTNETYALAITSAGVWYLYIRKGESWERLQSESLAVIDTSPTGSNHVRVMALGDEGWLFVNGELAGELDLSSWDQAGDVRAIGSFFRNSEVAGKAIEFEDFAVWSLGE